MGGVRLALITHHDLHVHAVPGVLDTARGNHLAETIGMVDLSCAVARR